MWGLERPPNAPKWIPWKCWCTRVLGWVLHMAKLVGGFCTWTRLAVYHDIARWLGGEFCEKMKFVIFEMWGLERPPNAPKWIPWKCWCTRVLGWVLHMAKLVGAPRHSYMVWWWALWKIEIRGFWDVRVAKASKCPQMNTMKVLVHESFEFGGFCPWPRLAVHHGIARWLRGEFCEKMKFVIFEKWWLERPPNVPKCIPWKSWCTKVLSSVGFAHGQGLRCTTA